MKLSDLLVPEGPVLGNSQTKSVQRLEEIEDIHVLFSFMVANNCQNEGCFIKAIYQGEEVFVLCTTLLGFLYYDFMFISEELYTRQKELFDILQKALMGSCLGQSCL